MTVLVTSIQDLDNQLSNRYIELDPGGYWLVKVDADQGQLVIEHYSNGINEQGLAVDPDSGEVIACRGGNKRLPTRIIRGHSAKEVCVKLFEESSDCPMTMLNHAAYLGRELMRAEIALTEGKTYIQD